MLPYIGARGAVIRVLLYANAVDVPRQGEQSEQARNGPILASFDLTAFTYTNTVIPAAKSPIGASTKSNAHRHLEGRVHDDQPEK